MRNFLTIIAALVLSMKAGACSFAPGYFGFEASPSDFEMKMDKGVIALLPAPKVVIDKVIRGSAAPGSSCDDAGMIHLTLEWPNESVYKIEDVGFYFQSENGIDPDLIFPLSPVKGEIKDNTSKFFFVWLDGHPKHQKALDFKVNVFAVNKGLQVGQSTTINIKAGKG
jgi:hypothetical protein